jgi:hypothetical protein
VNVDAVMIGELQGDVRSVLEVLWRDWFGINPTAGAGLLERAHSVVLLAMIVAAAVGGWWCARPGGAGVPCWGPALRPPAVADRGGRCCGVGGGDLGGAGRRAHRPPAPRALGCADPAALAHLAAAPGDTGGWALVGMVTVGWVTLAQLSLAECSPLVLVVLLGVIPLTAPGSLLPIARRRWWAMIAAIATIVGSKPAAAAFYSLALGQLPGAHDRAGRTSVVVGLVAATAVWPMMWRAFRSLLPDPEPGRGGGGGGHAPDPRPDGGGRPVTPHPRRHPTWSGSCPNTGAPTPGPPAAWACRGRRADGHHHRNRLAALV